MNDILQLKSTHENNYPIKIFANHQPYLIRSYNNFNKQQYQNIQSQAFGAHNYQHQTHHTPQFKPQQNVFQQQNSYQPNRNVIPITSYKNDISHDGSYQYSYSTGNGIKADETGYLKNRGSQNQAQVAQVC